MSVGTLRRRALLRLDRVVVFDAFLLLGALVFGSRLLAGPNGMRITGRHAGCDPSLVGAG